MAYVVGLLAADGSIRHNKRGAWYFDLQLVDKQLMHDVKEILQSNHVITCRKREKPKSNLYRLQIGSKEMCNDLAKWGIVSNKTFDLVLPDIPEKYLGDFVRGYFDGDGCIYFKSHFAKDRQKKRWVFQVKFISGCKEFLLMLQIKLFQKNCNKGYIYSKKRGYELVYSHRDGLALFHLMYNNEPHIFLERKYVKYRDAIKTLHL